MYPVTSSAIASTSLPGSTAPIVPPPAVVTATLDFHDERLALVLDLNALVPTPPPTPMYPGYEPLPYLSEFIDWLTVELGISTVSRRSSRLILALGCALEENPAAIMRLAEELGRVAGRTLVFAGGTLTPAAQQELRELMKFVTPDERGSSQEIFELLAALTLLTHVIKTAGAEMASLASGA